MITDFAWKDPGCKAKVEIKLTADQQGRLGGVISLRNLSVKRVRGRAHFCILEAIGRSKQSVSADNLEMPVSVILKLIAKPSQRQLQRLRWGEIRKLSKRKA